MSKSLMSKQDDLSSNILTTFALTLFLGFFLRALFLFINGSFIPFDWQILKVFIIGLMIDSSVLSILFMPTCLSFIFKSSVFHRLKTAYMTFVIFLFIMLSFVDIVFFQIYYDRTHAYAFGQFLDISSTIPIFLSIYHKFPFVIFLLPSVIVFAYFFTRWSISLVTLYHLISGHYFLKKPLIHHLNNTQYYQIAFFHVLLLFLTSFIYLQPLITLNDIIHRPFQKTFYQVVAKNAFYNLSSYLFLSNKINLGLNTDPDVSETFQDIIKSRHTELLNENNIVRQFKNPQTKLQTKPHIVLVSIDSLSAKFLESTPEEDSFLPYLNQMAREGLSFKNFYFHWQCSFNALLSLLMGFPMIDGYHFQPDNSLNKKSLMQLLKPMGYTSLLAVGSGLYNMEPYFLEYGGDKVIVPKYFSSHSLRGVIQIDDRKLISSTLDEIQRHHQKGPLFVKMIFNSLHFGDVINSSSDSLFQQFAFDEFCQLNPQSIYSQDLQKGLCYTNWLVENFVKDISALLGDNLIIVLTGDHRSWNPITYQANTLQSLQVPLIILDQRGLTKKGEISKVGSHQDVSSTLLYMIGYEGWYSFIGRNLLNDEEGIALFSDSHYYWYRKGSYLLEYKKALRNTQVFQIKKFQTKIKINDPHIQSQLEQEFYTYFTGLDDWISSSASLP